jgi:hypothetical protein
MKAKQTEFQNLDNLIAQANPEGAPRKAARPVIKTTTISHRPRKHIAEQFEFPIDRLIAEANRPVLVLPGVADSFRENGQVVA